MDPLTVAVLTFGGAFAADLTKGVVTDIAKSEFYKVLEKRAKSSSLAEALYNLAHGVKRPLVAPASTPEEHQADLAAIAADIEAATAGMEGADREGMRAIGDAFVGLAKVLTWFHASEASKRLPATRWLDGEGQFRPWTAHPWFVAFDYGTPEGRFWLLALGATWNFNKGYEEGEGFTLYLADAFKVPDLRARLRAFKTAAEASGEPDAGTWYRAAVEAGLLSDEALVRVKQYVRLVGWLEDAAEQRRLPDALVSDINADKVRRIAHFLGEPAYGLEPRLAVKEAPKPTLYVDFLMAIATVEAHFEKLDAFLQPGSNLGVEGMAALVAELRGMKASFLTKRGEDAAVLKAKLPLVLRELRGAGMLTVDPCFCSTPDSHLRRSLRRLYPAHFNNAEKFPSISLPGSKFVRGELQKRFGPSAEALVESPVNGTYYEVLLVSSLAYLMAPGEPFLYDIPLFLHDMVGDVAPVAPGKLPVALVGKVAEAPPEVPGDVPAEAPPGADVPAASQSPWWKFWAAR